MRHVILLTLLLAASQLIASCSSAEEPGSMELGAGFEVYEQRVFWLDEDTLVFPARSHGSSAFDMWVWRPGGAPVRYARPEWTSADRISETYFCGSHGRIAFAPGPPRITEVPYLYEYQGISGSPGAEAPAIIRSWRPTKHVPGVTERPLGLIPANSVWSIGGDHLVGIDCAEVSDASMIGRWWASTYPGQPYVVFDQNFDLSFTNVRLRTGDEEIPLAIESPLTAPSCVHATPWNGRIWVWTCRAFSNPGPRSAWDVDVRSGDVVRTDLPWRPAMRNLFAFPTRVGLFGANDIEPAADSGFFKLGPNGPTRLLGGRFGSAYVSPNGCLVALSQYKSAYGNGATLIVVDVCAPSVAGPSVDGAV